MLTQVSGAVMEVEMLDDSMLEDSPPCECFRKPNLNLCGLPSVARVRNACPCFDGQGKPRFICRRCLDDLHKGVMQCHRCKARLSLSNVEIL